MRHNEAVRILTKFTDAGGGRTHHLPLSGPAFLVIVIKSLEMAAVGV